MTLSLSRLWLRRRRESNFKRMDAEMGGSGFEARSCDEAVDVRDGTSVNVFVHEFVHAGNVVMAVAFLACLSSKRLHTTRLLKRQSNSALMLDFGCNGEGQQCVLYLAFQRFERADAL